MKFGNLKQDKGVAGTTVLLSLIVALFVIGLLVMIFAIMGGTLKSSSSVGASETGSAEQNGITFSDGGTTLTTCNSATNGAVTTIAVVNATGGETVNSANYTFSGCVLTAAAGSEYNSTLVNSSYSYTYAGTAYDVINDTTGSIASVTTFFSLFIVIGSMVVLILLTVIIIVAIRQSGMLSGGTA
jgi:hypothetical protein